MANEKEIQIKISGKVDISLNMVSKKVDKVFSRMMKIAKSATNALGSAASDVIRGSLEVGSSFESQMSTVKAISEATEKQITQLEEKAKEMGATTQYTATESGQAMEYMAMAGWKTKDMLNGIGGIMDLAAASGEDLAKTSDIVTDALSAFKMEAKESAHFSDVLAAASSNSNTNVGILGESFKQVAPVAGSMKYSIEDVSLTLGLMANQSVKGSKAGTSLKTAIANMAAPTKKMQEAMKKYNISLKDGDGKTKSLREVIDDVRNSIGGLSSKTERAAAISTIFGKEAMPAMSAIVNASEKDYRKLAGSIDNASGAAERMAKVRLDNLQGDVTIFQSALEGKGIELYDEIKEPMREIVQSATDWLEEIDVARVVDDFKDFGLAVLDFSEPLLEVGEWMIMNPDAIAGPLAGIGSAIASYKLLDTVSKLGKGLQGLISGVTAHPYMVGGALVVGALTGIAVAIEETEQAAANASLEDHFGDIALSMDQIQDAADNIIGSKKLEKMEKFMNSIKVSEGFKKEMEKAAEEIEKIEWKISAGLELDEEDMNDLKKNMQNYVQKTQKLIDQEGYTVNVATKFLFGNSETGKDIIEQNNGFFGSLKMEAQTLDAQINDVLERMINPKLKPEKKKKLQKELNGYYEELQKINDKILRAETRASWDIIEMDFSGKELDPETYKKLVDATNKNVEKVKKAAYEAKENVVRIASGKLEDGHMSPKEYEDEKAAAEKAYQERIKEAEVEAAKVQYNTLMSTYGEEIASGEYKPGDKSAIAEVVAGLKDLDLQGSEGEIIDILDKGFNGGPDAYTRDDRFGMSNQEVFRLTSSQFAKNYLEKKSGLSEEAKRIGDKTAYDIKEEFALERAPQINAESPFTSGFSPVKKEEKIEEGTTGLQGAPVNILGGFVEAVPAAVAKMEEEAKKGGTASGEAFAKALSDEILKIDPINIPVELILPVAPTTAKKGKKKGEKTSDDSIVGYAEGTISNKAHIAAVSEGNKTEAIIPIDGSARSRRLYEATGKLMGYNKTSSQGVTFAPNINITLTGKASAEDKNEIRNLVQKELDKQYKKMIRDNKRFNMRQ